MRCLRKGVPTTRRCATTASASSAGESSPNGWAAWPRNCSGGRKPAGCWPATIRWSSSPGCSRCCTPASRRSFRPTRSRVRWRRWPMLLRLGSTAWPPDAARRMASLRSIRTRRSSICIPPAVPASTSGCARHSRSSRPKSRCSNRCGARNSAHPPSSRRRRISTSTACYSACSGRWPVAGCSTR